MKKIAKYIGFLGVAFLLFAATGGHTGFFKNITGATGDEDVTFNNSLNFPGATITKTGEVIDVSLPSGTDDQTGSEVSLVQNSGMSANVQDESERSDSRLDAIEALPVDDLSNNTTTDLPEGTNLYYTDVRVSANADVVANTAKNTYPAADAAKLSGIETAATADQNAAEVSVAFTPTNYTSTAANVEANLVGINQALEKLTPFQINHTPRSLIVNSVESDYPEVVGSANDGKSITKLIAAVNTPGSSPLNFRIDIMDAAGNTTQGTSTFFVGSTTAPLIVNVTPIALSEGDRVFVTVLNNAGNVEALYVKFE